MHEHDVQRLKFYISNLQRCHLSMWCQVKNWGMSWKLARKLRSKSRWYNCLLIRWHLKTKKYIYIYIFLVSVISFSICLYMKQERTTQNSGSEQTLYINSPMLSFLKEAEAVTLRSLEHLLLFISDPKGHSKWSSWSAISKLMKTKRVTSCDSIRHK